MRGTPIDRRSDIFSLGVVLWEMVAGQRLFATDSEADTLENVLMLPIAEPSRRRDGVPAVLDAITARALERDPERRYESAQAFADELDRFLVEMPMADQALPQLLDELFNRLPPAKSGKSGESLSATYTASATGPVATRGTGSRAAYRSVMLPPVPKIALSTLIGIFALVVAGVVIVGRMVLHFRPPPAQSSSAKSVSTSR